MMGLKLMWSVMGMDFLDCHCQAMISMQHLIEKVHLKQVNSENNKTSMYLMFTSNKKNLCRLYVLA